MRGVRAGSEWAGWESRCGVDYVLAGPDEVVVVADCDVPIALQAGGLGRLGRLKAV